MSIAPYIKEIGRGKDGARPLDATQAQDLFGQVLDRTVSAAQIGAFCVAMRIKGETSSELQGFEIATRQRQIALPRALATAHDRVKQGQSSGIVILPSYNGARRLPNLTALLAAHLSAQGVCVLVHGLAADPTRVTTQQVFAACGLPIVRTDDELAAAWNKGAAAYIDITELNPGLAGLLAMRWELGLRNPAHTIAKLLDPWPTADVPRMRVVNHTHPEYAGSLTAFLTDTAANAMLMRGTEGEPVADARRQPRCDTFLAGQRVDPLSLAPQEGVLQALPDLPGSCDADSTATYIQAVLTGQRPLPTSIAEQARVLLLALQQQSATAP